MRDKMDGGEGRSGRWVFIRWMVGIETKKKRKKGRAWFNPTHDMKNLTNLKRNEMNLESTKKLNKWYF